MKMWNTGRLAVTAGLALVLGAGFAPAAFAEEPAEVPAPAAEQQTAAADDQAKIPFEIYGYEQNVQDGGIWWTSDTTYLNLFMKTFENDEGEMVSPKVTWSCSDPSLVTIDPETGDGHGNGKVGDAVVTATEVGGSGRSQSVTLHMVDMKDVTGVISANWVAVDSQDLNNGYSVKYPASYLNRNPSYNATVMYARFAVTLPNGEIRYVGGGDMDYAMLHCEGESSNESVVTTDGVNLRFQGVGQADVTLKFWVKSYGSDEKRLETKTIHVNVVEDSPEDHGTAMQSDGKPVMVVGSALKLDAVDKWTGVVVTDSMAWTSSDPSVATVDENGNVTSLKPGKATFTASYSDGAAAASATVTFIDPQDVQFDGISTFALSSMGDESLPIANGQTLTLDSVKDYGGALVFNATRYTYEGEEVGGAGIIPKFTITSSNEKVAKPAEDSNRLNFVGAGTTQVTVTPASKTRAVEDAQALTFTLVIKDDNKNPGQGGSTEQPNKPSVDDDKTTDGTDKGDKKPNNKDNGDKNAADDAVLPQTGDLSLVAPLATSAFGVGSVALGMFLNRRRK